MDAAAWRGAVPMTVRLARADVAESVEPAPVALLGRRRSYLRVELARVIGPLLLRAAGAPLSEADDAEAVAVRDMSWWVSQVRRTEPVRDELPLGVLYDARARSGDGSLSALCASDGIVWDLELHVGKHPQDVAGEASRARFFHSLKCAVVGVLGAPTRFFALRAAELDALWDHVAGDWEDGRAHRSMLEDVCWGSARPDRVPLRVLWVTPSASDVTGRTLFSAAVSDARLWPSDASAAPPSPLLTLREAVQRHVLHSASSALPAGAIFTVQGLVLHGAEPLAPLWAALRHPDGILYVVLHAPAPDR
jgi:Autophagy protein Apg5